MPSRQSRRRARLPARNREGGGAGYLLVAVGALLLALTTGQALAGTVAGGWGDDALRGTGREDRLAGFGGDDELWGLGGNDFLAGGEGDNELYGGEGRDVLAGGAGDDFIEAKDGQQDYVECGPGADVASVDARDLGARGCDRLFRITDAPTSRRTLRAILSTFWADNSLKLGLRTLQSAPSVPSLSLV